jgi:thiamine-phosphate pyrophosphorylase
LEQLAAGGATLVQLRDKTTSPREFYEQAIEAVKVARSLDVRVIVNDRVDIAVAVGADGVHLGQEDLPADRVRSLLGAERIIGFSTHSLEQAVRADSLPIDYIAVGPVFETATKERPDPVVGLLKLGEIKSRITKPLVGIGGITLDRAREVIAAGADSVAVISDLVSTNDIAGRTRMFLSALGD